MTPERLKKVEEIYHAVLEVSPSERSRFLLDNCGDDEQLRLEIESLLSFEKTSSNVIDSPPNSYIKEILADQTNSKIIGRRINQYKILSLLGEGGMGSVFLAQDTKLERRVAIKFLSEEFIERGHGLDRFFLEAKSSSALNHPNIITVYEIGEYEERHFIVTEFIDGHTLKKHLSKKQITLDEILGIAIQIASALSTAHQAGIIHRDIKPDNIMIRRDGIAKVLDFGLAKLIPTADEVDSEAVTQANFLTMRGVILGTPQFMSPEQARGKKLDTRTDIWSFGVLLYLMLTKKLPFQGETTSDIIAAILKSEPPPLTEYVSDIPPELEKITLKTLRKNLKERFQTIDEILAELKRVRHEIEVETKTQPVNLRVSTHAEEHKITDAEFARITAGNSTFHSGKFISIISQTFSQARKFPVISLLILATLVSILVFVSLGVSKLFLTANQIESFQQMKLAKLTFDGTVTNRVAISPDGKYIVYVLREEGKQALMVRQLASSSVIQLIAPAEVIYTGLTFSADGNFIKYSVFENNAGNLYEIPVFGGNPRKLMENVSREITFSPDGKMLAFVNADNLLMLADAKGGSPRLLATAPEKEIWTKTAFSPDGKTVLSGLSSPAGQYLVEISITDGAIKPFSSLRWTGINGLAWLSDKSGIILAGRDPGNTYSQIWFVSYPTGQSRRITNDFSTYSNLSLTADNKMLVSIKEERLYNIWVSPDGKQDSLKKISLEEGRDEGIAGLTWTPDGKIVYTVRTVDNFDIWIVNADGSGNRQLTFGEGTNFQPAVSPDGKYIVFSSNRTGNLNLWRIQTDGSEPTLLTDTSDVIDYPSFTPDGKWILYRRKDSKNLNAIWKLNLENGNSIQLTEIESWRPTVSPDGKFFACEYGEEKPGQPPKLAIIPIEGGKPSLILDLPLVLKSRVFRWAKDGKSLIYINKRDRIDNLWSQTLDNSPPKQITFFESGQIERFDLAPDGQGLALSRGAHTSDAVMFEDFR